MSNDTKTNTTGGNLDITLVPNEQPEQLALLIEQFYKDDSTAKARLSYNWERNHRFLDGDQWLVFDGSREAGGIWNKLKVSKENEYIPRPVTNYIFDNYQTLKSYLVKVKPRSSVRPNTQTFKDKSAAKMADICLEVNWERLNEQNNYEYAASVLLTYGTCFKKDYWDTTNSNMVKIPRMEVVPQTDPATGDIIGQVERQMSDPETGEPMFDEVPLGDVNTDVVEPYRIALDPLCTDLHKARWIMEYSIQPIDWVVEMYSKEEEGYTGLAEMLKPEVRLSGSMARFHNLRNSSGVRPTAFAEGVDKDQSGTLTNSVVLKEYYERPSARHPKGRLIVVANGVTLYAGKSSASGPDQGSWHPYSECRWEIVPGRFWGKSPLDAACEIQKQVNSIDSVLILTRKTSAIPQKLIPAGSGIEPGTWTGRPGQQITYRPTGDKPELLAGKGVDESVFVEREKRVEDMKAITGAIDILKGDRPPGVTAASAINMLYEVGTGKLFPIIDRWRKFVESSQKKQLYLIANKYKEPRPDFIRMLKAKNTELSEQMISRFIGTDLYDNCNVIIEAGSNVPKLQSAQQAQMMEAAQVGTLDLMKPENRREFNRKLGIDGFDNDIGRDIKRAEWENDLLDNIEQTPDNKPVVLYADEDQIHISVHEGRMKEPSFMEQSEAVQQAYMAHTQEHRDMMAQKAQAAALEAMALGQPIEPAPGMSASPAKGQGPGIPQQQKNSLRSDANVPGQPSGGPTDG